MQTKIVSVLTIVVARKKKKIETAALTAMLAEGKADPKLFFAKKISHDLNFFSGF